ncbi:hypothetical protein BcDW1_9654 [Botrytis cinerea BcDW1]|uniref:Uncharacterized protein n=1 Tax=Botryotinia fuckeliana (strain BcDW1) TaxID=1290391 RepID=M7TK46_BOTF1|nr:hypothetical protein BcDW1_9654 [Botrytis cinerea BcDW1]
MSPHLPTPSPLFRLLTPLLQSFRSTFPSTTSTAPLRTFTSTPTMHKKNPNSKTDPRVTLIRYHLQHPKTPRPLRFSRTRESRGLRRRANYTDFTNQCTAQWKTFVFSTVPVRKKPVDYIASLSRRKEFSEKTESQLSTREHKPIHQQENHGIMDGLLIKLLYDDCNG